MNPTLSTWSYFASISHKLVKERHSINLQSPEYQRMNNSLNMLILLGFAASIEGFIRNFLFQIDVSETEKKNCIFHKILIFFKKYFSRNKKKEISLEKQTWNDLKGTFKNITGKKLSTILKEKDRTLNKKIDGLFLYRNFLVHSKNISISENRVYVERISDYIEEWKIGKEEVWTLDNIISDEIIDHFKKVHLDFMSINYRKYLDEKFHSLADELSEKNDFETNEYLNGFWHEMP